MISAPIPSPSIYGMMGCSDAWIEPSGLTTILSPPAIWICLYDIMTPLYKKKKPCKRMGMICDKRPEALQGQSAEPGIYIDMEIPSAARRRLTGAQKESRTGSNATGCEFYRDAAKNRCRRKCTAI